MRGVTAAVLAPNAELADVADDGVPRFKQLGEMAAVAAAAAPLTPPDDICKEVVLLSLYL